MQFTRPIYLLLLIPLIYYTFSVARHSLADMSRFRSRLALALRLVILLALVFALAGARTVRDASQQCVVFVLDRSDSIPKGKQDAAVDYLNKALKSLRSDQKAGVVVFGRDASVELLPCNAHRIGKLYSAPDPGSTDISQALGLALAVFPERCAKKIVLLSDGNETTGKSFEQALLAGSNGVSIDTVPITNDLPSEALLERMICPASVKIGEPFDLKVIAVSKKPTVATIRLIKNGSPAETKAVELAAGKSVLSFQQSLPKPGSYEYQAVLECVSDTRVENNVAFAHTKVKGKPRVLYVEGEPGQEKYLSAALESSDIVVDQRDPAGIPSSMSQLQGYDMVVLSDVPAWRLSPEQMAMIRAGVKDLGIGFTMIGGENSFGAGGYFDTPIEEALPVEMSIRKTKVLPTLSVVIAMDKSGSMGMSEGGREKIQLANDAAASVVRLLQPIDYVGIIVCHSSPVAAVDLQLAANKGPIYDQISTIRAEGGGIAVFPSMRMAYDMMSRAKTRQKHIILLADGADCDDQAGVVPLAKKMARERITVTAVAIGDGKDVPFLKTTAAAGKGYFYLAQRARDLKAIFTKDIMTISKSLIIEEPFTPSLDTSSPELGGVDAASVPPLLGYVVTSPKPAARVSAISHRKDPILATWQFGLGKSAAFTSDCKARWSGRWLTWPDYNKFWAQVLRSTMRKSGPRDFQSTVDIESGTGRVTVDAVDENGAFLNFLKFKGSVIGPDMKSHQIKIEQTGPGRYEADFDAREVGVYVVNVVSQEKGDNAQDVNVVSIPYPVEYKALSPNTALLKRISQETQGRFDPPAVDVLAGRFRRSQTYTDIWRALAMLAMILLPLDIAVRRLAVSPGQVVEICVAARDRVSARLLRRRARRPIKRSETVSALLKTKKKTAKLPTEPQVPVPPVTPPEPQPVQTPPEATPAASDGDTTSRLLEAKRRARKQDR